MASKISNFKKKTFKRLEVNFLKSKHVTSLQTQIQYCENKSIQFLFRFISIPPTKRCVKNWTFPLFDTPSWTLIGHLAPLTSWPLLASFSRSLSKNVYDNKMTKLWLWLVYLLALDLWVLFLKVILWKSWRRRIMLRIREGFIGCLKVSWPKALIWKTNLCQLPLRRWILNEDQPRERGFSEHFVSGMKTAVVFDYGRAFSAKHGWNSPYLYTR